jgi:iron-sulfur cluster assembly protein
MSAIPTTSVPDSTAAAAAPASAAVLVREGNENLVKLTGPAGAKVNALIAREKQGDYLRIAITGGGCNGLSYKMRFVPEAKKGDILVNTSGARVLVDPKTALYLKGTVLDYSNQMVGGGFKFTNPNAKASCSCGESFSV